MAAVTNALRLVKQANLSVDTREYPVIEDDFDGTHVAEAIGMPCEQVFKTLVVQNASKDKFVCVIPVSETLNLKKAAKASGQKSIEMMPLKDLTPVTGYVRGGCSPVGMKKKLPTFVDETAQLFDTISVSAGMRGLQMIISPDDLVNYTNAVYADLTD